MIHFSFKHIFVTFILNLMINNSIYYLTLSYSHDMHTSETWLWLLLGFFILRKQVISLLVHPQEIEQAVLSISIFCYYILHTDSTYRSKYYTLYFVLHSFDIWSSTWNFAIIFFSSFTELISSSSLLLPKVQDRRCCAFGNGAAYSNIVYLKGFLNYSLCKK